MYFKNIQNNELQMFHKSMKNNFKMKLTDVLVSDLFLVEEIIEDTIYRIFPLFYCDKITSTNVDDEIINTNCIICEKQSETVFSFIVNDEDITPIEILPNTIRFNGMDYVQGVVYNTETGEGINQATIHYIISKNDVVLRDETITTTEHGYFRIDSTDLEHATVKTLNVTATFKNQTATYERGIK